jgi:uncharacterized protein YfaA (DUF2138 family)
MTEARVSPWYRNTIELDRARVAQVNAAIAGEPLPEPNHPAARLRGAFLTATRYDADLFRAFIETTSLLTLPREVLARPGLVDTIVEVARDRQVVPPPGPRRGEALRIVS